MEIHIARIERADQNISISIGEAISKHPGNSFVEFFKEL